MTLLQKIQNLTWWTLDIKLKDILTDLFGRVEILEESGGGGTQDLQSVLDNGNYAEVDGGDSFISIFGETPNDRYMMLRTKSILPNSGEEVSKAELYLNQSFAQFGSSANGYRGYIRVEDGKISFNNFLLGNGNTEIVFTDPTVDSTLQFPAKTISGNYTINTTPDITYTVSTLPSGVLNDMAIVTDATAPTYLGALIGGGAVVTPVWHNGTIWVAR